MKIAYLCANFRTEEVYDILYAWMKSDQDNCVE